MFRLQNLVILNVNKLYEFNGKSDGSLKGGIGPDKSVSELAPMFRLINLDGGVGQNAISYDNVAPMFRESKNLNFGLMNLHGDTVSGGKFNGIDSTRS